MSEAKRGCGYRKAFGLYLVCDGASILCDGLPLPLEPCSCCNFKPMKVRNLQRVNGSYIQQISKKKHQPQESDFEETPCSCLSFCPACFPEPEQIYGLMYVGREYTPATFIQEAKSMGISKRIPDIPKWMILGETWVFLAHSEVPTKKTLAQIEQNGIQAETKKTEQIFYGFKPQRIEMPAFQGELTFDEILILEKRGITVKLLDDSPENKKLHKYAKNWKPLLDRLLKEGKELIEEENKKSMEEPLL